MRTIALVNGYSGYAPHVFVADRTERVAGVGVVSDVWRHRIDRSEYVRGVRVDCRSRPIRGLCIEGSPAADSGAGPRTVQYVIGDNPAGIVRDGSIRIGSKTIPIHQEGDGDTTPPILTPTVTGTEVNGWYTSDITVTWSVTDPESEIVSQYGCYSNDLHDRFPGRAAVLRGDQPRRHRFRRASICDATRPVQQITIPPPAATYLHPRVVRDCRHSAATTRIRVPRRCTNSRKGPSPLDTTPGWHTFTVSTTDHAGNASTKSVTYLVGTGVCVAPNDGLRAHWRFNSSLLDVSQQNYADPTPYFAPSFTAGVAGLGWWKNPSQTNSYLTVYDGNRTYQGDEYTVALWLKPWSVVGESGTIVAREPQYRIARYPDGTLRWAFNHTTGFNWVNTGIVLPVNVWAHVAVTYDHGLVNTYINGQLAHTYQLTGTRIDGASNGPTIGGRPEVTAVWVGGMDELEIYQSALSATEVEALALAGNGSTCLPAQTSVSVSVPSTVPFGPTYSATVTLQDQSGNPMADRLTWLYSLVGPGPGMSSFTSCTTDSSGQCTAALNIPASADPRTYSYGVKARFDGDAHYLASEAVADVTLVRGTPQLTWPAPSAIVYGTALGATQLNATANAAGTFTYSPPAGTALGAGTHTLSVTFAPTDTVHWATTTVTSTITVTKATPVVTWANPAPINERVVLGSTQLNATASVPGTFAYSPSYWALLPPGTHTLTVNFTPSDSVNYNSTSKTVTVKVKAYPVISWPTPAAITYPATVSGSQLNATANVAGTFAYLPATGTLLDAGTHTMYVTFTPSNTADYESESATTTIEVLKGTATITWPELNPITYGAMLTGLHLNAATEADGWLTYSHSYGTILNAGTHTLTATFTPNYPYNYHPVTITRELLVRKAWPQLSWPGELASIRYGTPLSNAQLYATAVVPGTITYNYPAGTVLIAGTHIIRMTYTPDDPVNYHTLTESKNLFVDKGIPAITWSNPAPIVYGTPLSSSQLNATASVPGTFNYSPPLGAIVPAGTQPLYLTFTPTDSANYYITGDDVTIVVEKRTPVITWSNPASIVYGTALSSTQLNATTDVGTGTFVYSPSNGTVLSAGAGQTLSVTYQPAFGQANNYNPASATVTIDVLKVTPVITWLPATGITYGTPLGRDAAERDGERAGHVRLLAGGGHGARRRDAHAVGDVHADRPGELQRPTASVTLNVAKATTTIIWQPVADLIYGTRARRDAVERDAASVAGTFAYSPAAGHGAERRRRTHSRSPSRRTMPANYNGASANVTLTQVAKATSTITWPNPADIVYGTALGARS